MSKGTALTLGALAALIAGTSAVVIAIRGIDEPTSPIQESDPLATAEGPAPGQAEAAQFEPKQTDTAEPQGQPSGTPNPSPISTPPEPADPELVLRAALKEATANNKEMLFALEDGRTARWFRRVTGKIGVSDEAVLHSLVTELARVEWRQLNAARAEQVAFGKALREDPDQASEHKRRLNERVAETLRAFARDSMPIVNQFVDALTESQRKRFQELSAGEDRPWLSLEEFELHQRGG